MTLIRQPWRRQKLAAEVLFALLLAGLRVRVLPFRSYASKLGSAQPGEHHTGRPAEDTQFLHDLRWAVEALNQTAGGRFTCLMQGMAAKQVLNRRGVANSLVLGAKFDRSNTPEARELAAHAWLWVGQVIILGGEERDGFIPVTSYESDQG